MIRFNTQGVTAGEVLVIGPQFSTFGYTIHFLSMSSQSSPHCCSHYSINVDWQSSASSPLKGRTKGSTQSGSMISGASASFGLMLTLQSFRSWTATEGLTMARPINRMRPVHPGEVLREDYFAPLGQSVNARPIAQGSYDAHSRNRQGTTRHFGRSGCTRGQALR